MSANDRAGRCGVGSNLQGELPVAVFTNGAGSFGVEPGEDAKRDNARMQADLLNHAVNPSSPELLPRSSWLRLQERRARAHREFCVQAANKTVEELRCAGVNVVIFGSLAADPGEFRGDSDVDLCLLDSGGVPLSEIEDVVRAHLGLVRYDLVDFLSVGVGVREEVIANGVRHVR